MVVPVSLLRQRSFFFLLPLFSRGISSSDIYKWNLKINKLVKEGKIDGARQLFDEMPQRDAVTYNSMISAYCQRRDFDKAKNLFKIMPEKSVVSWNSMISLSFQSGDIDQAFDYFNSMPRRNISSWNSMISGLVNYDYTLEAERLFHAMPARNVISYTAMIDGLARMGRIRDARDLFDRMPRRNSITWAVMINGYVQNGLLFEARILFSQMPGDSIVAATAMVLGYCNEKRVDDARELFDAMHAKDAVSWNAMMSGYVRNECGEEALKLYVDMRRMGMKHVHNHHRDHYHSTILIILVACSVLSSIKCGRQVHATTIKMGVDFDLSVCNTCITMYSKCGSIDDSEMIFKAIHAPDLVSMNNIISAYGQHGLYDKACMMFQELMVNGLTPDDVTFLSILSACGHVGKVDESLLWLKKMFDFQVLPRREHFSCLVDILGRAGCVDLAYDIIDTMHLDDDGHVWSALLGSCRACMDIDIAELAVKRLVEIKPHDSGAYIMLSNIYAASGNWRGVTKIRREMKKKGVKKQPGYSWIEIGDLVHKFLGGDASHPDHKRVCCKLDVLHLHMSTKNIDFDDFMRSF